MLLQLFLLTRTRLHSRSAHLFAKADTFSFCEGKTSRGKHRLLPLGERGLFFKPRSQALNLKPFASCCAERERSAHKDAIEGSKGH